MTGSLVIHVCERCGYKKDCITMYIFYDYKTELYGIRFGSVNTMTDNTLDSVMKSYSYDCDNKYAILDLMKNLIPDENIAEIALIQYEDLPVDPNKITYEMLVHNDVFENEIIGCEFDGNKTDDEDINIVSPKRKMMEMLNIISHVYNEYYTDRKEKWDNFS